MPEQKQQDPAATAQGGMKCPTCGCNLSPPKWPSKIYFGLKWINASMNELWQTYFEISQDDD